MPDVTIRLNADQAANVEARAASWGRTAAEVIEQFLTYVPGSPLLAVMDGAGFPHSFGDAANC